jgi:uncharacterized membrane protein
MLPYLSTVLVALYVVLTSVAIRRFGVEPSQVLITTHLLASFQLLGIAVVRDELTHGAAFVSLPLLIVSALKYLSKRLHYYAISGASVADTSVFNSLTPVVSIVFSWVILSERFTPREGVGTFFILLCSYFFFWRPSAESFYESVISPWRAFTVSRHVKAALLCIVPLGLAPIFLKIGVHSYSPSVTAAVVTIHVTLIALTIRFVTNRGQVAFDSTSTASMMFMFSISVIFTLAQYTNSASLRDYEVATVVTIQRLSLPVQLLLAVCLLRERDNLFWKLFLSFIMIIFSLLLM